MNQLASSKSSGLWPNCRYGQLSIDDQNQLLVTDAFLTHLIRRPEPVYMGIAADENNRLRIKSQNLLLNLPLALRS